VGQKAYATPTTKAKKDEEVRSTDRFGTLSEVKPMAKMWTRLP